MADESKMHRVGDGKRLKRVSVRGSTWTTKKKGGGRWDRHLQEVGNQWRMLTLPM